MARSYSDISIIFFHPRCQWRVNGSFELIDGTVRGEQNETLGDTNLEMSNSVVKFCVLPQHEMKPGYYYCMVSNNLGSVVSNKVQVLTTSRSFSRTQPVSAQHHRICVT